MADSTSSAKRSRSGGGLRAVQKAPHSPGMALDVMTDDPPGDSSALSSTVRMGVLCFALLMAFPAEAGSLRDSLFGLRPRDGRESAAPPVARYVTEDGDV